MVINIYLSFSLLTEGIKLLATSTGREFLNWHSPINTAELDVTANVDTRNKVPQQQGLDN